MSRKCQISGRQGNNAYSVSHSHVRTKKHQSINLQRKKIWLKTESKWIKLRVSTKSIKMGYKISI